MIEFSLIFKSDNIGEIKINEPIGFAQTDFQLKQEDKRYARDVSFSGGENEFMFTDLRHEEALNYLLYYHNTFGTEALVSAKITFDTGYTILGDIHFETASTDGLTYFKCKVVQDSAQATLKRNKEIKVDILSNKDINGNTITPLVGENLLLKAKPIKQFSSWESLKDYSKNLDSIGEPRTTFYAFNPAIQLKEYGVENSYTFFQDTEKRLNNYGEILRDSFKILTAKQNLSDIKLTTSDFYLNINTDVDNGGNGYVDGSLLVLYGEDILTAQLVSLLDWNLNEYESFTHNGALSFNLPFLKRGDSIWFCFYQKVRQSSESVAPLVEKRFEAFTNIKNFNFSVEVQSIAFSSVVPSYRLFDVISQNVKSISGLNTVSNDFGASGHLYNQRLINGNCLRGITTRPFYTTLKDIEEGLIEFNADYEILASNNVSIRLYKDFYPNNEVGYIDTVQFDSMNKTFNPRYVINEFGYKWKGYQSQKESTLENTYDVIHGESQWFRPNSLASNKKEVEINWTRDAFDIEFNRIKGFQEKPSTATQDDDKLYLIDTIEITDESERYFEETATLLHSYSNGINKLANDSSFNWTLLGLRVGETFTILSNENQGNYTILEITPNFLSLERTSPGVADLQGEFTTTFKYYVSSATANYTIWTDEGFEFVNGLNGGDNYVNLRFSTKRNIVNYWNQYLATCNIYKKDTALRNTFYKNNPNCETSYQGVILKEGSDFLPSNPILTPVLYEGVTFICDFEEFKEFETKVRLDGGYFRFLDNNGQVIKGYPKNMKYSTYKRELVCDLEEKYEPAYMTIERVTAGMIVINSETTVNSLKYEFDSKKLFIFDSDGIPLYNGVFWNKVSVNGAIASTIYELRDWLNLL